MPDVIGAADMAGRLHLPLLVVDLGGLRCHCLRVGGGLEELPGCIHLTALALLLHLREGAGKGLKYDRAVKFTMGLLINSVKWSLLR